MIAFLSPGCGLRARAEAIELIERHGLRVHVDRIEGREALGVVGPGVERVAAVLAALPAVAEVRRVPLPYALVSRAYHPEPTVVHVGEQAIGGPALCLVAGPCSVESEEQIVETARAVAAAGARLLRGGAFKPRTSPYSFQGLGVPGLELLSVAREETGLAVVTEVVAPEDVELVARHADVLQVGARNMQNFRLLQALAASRGPCS